MYTRPTWKDLVEDKQRRQQEAIPKEWLIPPVDKEHKNILETPLTCGLLSPREIEITGVSDVSIILDNLATARWSAVEVTTAFAKRAIIAHQLVRFPIYVPSLRGVLMRAAIRQIVLRRSLSRRPSRVQPSLMITFERMGQ